MMFFVTMTYDEEHFFTVKMFADTSLDAICNALKLFPGALWTHII